MSEVELRKTIQSTNRDRKYVEEMELGSIIVPAILMNKWDVYIYGRRHDTIALLNYLKYLGIKPLAVYDCDASKCGGFIYGIKVKNSVEMSRISNPSNAFVIVNIADFQGVKAYEIYQTMYRAGIDKCYIVRESERLNINAYNSEWTEAGRDEYYKANEDGLIAIYNSLIDDTSRDTMIEYIRRYTEYGTYRNESIDGRLKYFFGLRNGRTEQIYNKKKNEVWLNCGANIGDSIFLYYSNGLEAKKILAYEGNYQTYKTLKNNLEFLPLEHKRNIVTINEMITKNTNIDKWLEQDEKISLINADIEGNEADMIRALSETIKNDRPVLALSAYHKASDIVELPNMVKNLVEDYAIVFRKYESSARDISRSSELVVYCIPNERLCLLN